MSQVKITQKTGRIGYELPFEGFVDLTKELKGTRSNEQTLAIVNRLLAKQRISALDHERGGEMFHGAALVKTTEGKWFLQANIHLHSADTTRNCAEANAITEARGREGKRLGVAEIWFMGGKANFELGQIFLGNEGQRNAPCGSCLDIIYDQRVRISGETLVHMIPLNDGKTKLLPGDPHDFRPESELEKNRVVTRRISDLLPNLTRVMEDRNGTIRATAQKGYDWLRNPETQTLLNKAILKQNLIEIQQLEDKTATPTEKLTAINKALMDAAREYYQTAEDKPTRLSVAIVRAADGKYYLAKHMNNGKVMATPNASAEAIGRMIDASANNKLTDIFLVEFDEKQLEALAENKPIELKMPDGATRELIKKAAPKNGIAGDIFNLRGEALSKTGAMVHVFVPNDPTTKEFAPNKHIVSYSIRDLLPYAFNSPKQSAGRAS